MSFVNPKLGRPFPQEPPKLGRPFPQEPPP